MSYIRLWIRFTLAVLWTSVLMAARLALRPVALFSERLDRRLRRATVRLWCRPYFYLIGMRVKVEGPRPQAPFLLVSNHLSYVDTWLLNGLLGCTFVARGDIQHWPVIGFISKSLNALFIDRASKRDTVRINQLIQHTLEQGDALVIFAESRISRGLDVEPFKSALIEPAVVNEIPVHYVAIHYETLPGCAPANEIVGWWRPEPFFYHLRRLLGNKGFVATVRFGEAPIAGRDRKELAIALHEAVRAKFTPVR